MNGLAAMNCSDNSSFNNVRTRGHDFKLYSPECILDATRVISLVLLEEFAIHATIYHQMSSTLLA